MIITIVVAVVSFAAGFVLCHFMKSARFAAIESVLASYERVGVSDVKPFISAIRRIL